jgi:hypothetical protein
MHYTAHHSLINEGPREQKEMRHWKNLHYRLQYLLNISCVKHYNSIKICYLKILYCGVMMCFIFVLVSENTTFCIDTLHVTCLPHVLVFWLSSGIVQCVSLTAPSLYWPTFIRDILYYGFFTLRCNAPTHVFH